MHSLEHNRARYEYDYKKLPGLPILKSVPPEDESFNSFSWVRSVVSLLLRVRANLGLQDSEKRGQFCQLALYFALSLVLDDPKKENDLKKFWYCILSIVRWAQRILNLLRFKTKPASDSDAVMRSVNRVRIEVLIPNPKKSIKNPRPSIQVRESKRQTSIETTDSTQKADLLRKGDLEKKTGIIETRLSFTDYQYLLEPYNDVFQIIYLPEISKYFHLDRAFAAQRVAGANPLVIERIDALPAHFSLSDAQYCQVMGSEDSLELAGKEGRLYLADYQVLNDVKTDDFPEKKQKYLYAPLALFSVPVGTRGNRSLVPVAIQCQQEPGEKNPIFIPPPPGTPQSKQWGWLIAKTIVQIADGNYHELISHLGRTHLLIELFAIATPRQLPSNHPLFVLLQPHFQGTLFINQAALDGLINEGGTVNAVLAGTLPESLRLSVKAVKGFPFSFNDSMLPKTLEARGVHEPDKLPDYPYRDDALLIWDAIKHWMSDYIDLYYKEDKDVQHDEFLQNWLRELRDQEKGAQMTDIGEADMTGNSNETIWMFRTKSYLVEAVTLIIFTASAQHAAVNFPQSNFLSYGPNMPLAGYRPSPTQLDTTAKDFFELLPSLPQVETQMQMTYLLGSVYDTQLGQYPENYFPDAVKPLLAKFQQRLQEIGLNIDDSNARRPTYYDYLHPAKIPQSINI